MSLINYHHRSVLKKSLKIQNFHVKVSYSLFVRNVEKIKDLKKNYFNILEQKSKEILYPCSKNNTNLKPYYRDLMKIVPTLCLQNFAIQKNHFENIINSGTNLKELTFLSQILVFLNY
mmetsp:Transcript_11265/g.9969  ORF Transcript_11265/g.9969 Transcript_11265/m.9969 type:complete len:118 (+) Transcript_11265:409-762(+)